MCIKVFFLILITINYINYIKITHTDDNVKEIIMKGNYNLLFFYLEENENDNRNDDKGTRFLCKNFNHFGKKKFREKQTF